jgi:hypothetical protein
MNTLKLIEIVDQADKDYALALVPADTLKKFAELIVNECANFVENIFDDDGGHAPKEDYAKGIKEHFGVEE